MSYSREADLSQKQVIDNLCAVLSSDYFKAYEFCYGGSKIDSDLISMGSIGGWAGIRDSRVKVADISHMLMYMLRSVQLNGTLLNANLKLTPSPETLREMGFEQGLFETDEEFDLPLVFEAQTILEKFEPTGKYCFRVAHRGFDESYFQAEGFDLKAAEKIVRPWYSNLTRNLKRILPNPIGKPNGDLEAQIG